MKYDYLIVGAGLFGAVFAHEMTKEGKKCLVIEKRNHIAGNAYTELKKILMCINTVRIFSIQIIKRYGNILISLLISTDLPTLQLLTTKENYIIYRLT